jgi:hypothetical protein
MSNGMFEILRLVRISSLYHFLLQLVRVRMRDAPIDTRAGTEEEPIKPSGPFSATSQHPPALLLFVPRNLKSRLIDDVTGGYGYSHVAIDCCEIDQPTGKRVMTESTTQDVVHRSFQDRYGARPFVRIPLDGAGVGGASFRKCSNDKLGEPYDDKEALTWGKLDDPAKQVCSDLAGDCLPERLRAAIARAHQLGMLGHTSVSVHRRLHKALRVFISPNGFAQFFGAPHGSRVSRPDVLAMPRPRIPLGMRARSRSLWPRSPLAALALMLSISFIFTWLYWRRALSGRHRFGAR